MGSSGGWLSRLVLGVIFLLAIQGANCEHEPTESECRPYIEKALKEHHVDEDTTEETVIADTSTDQEENPPTDEIGDVSDGESEEDNRGTTDDGIDGSQENDDGNTQEETDETGEKGTDEDENKTDEQNETGEVNDAESVEGETNEEGENADVVDQNETQEDVDANETKEAEGGDTAEVGEEGSQESDTAEAVDGTSQEGDNTDEGETVEEDGVSQEGDTKEGDDGESQEGSTKEEEENAEVDASAQEGDTAEETGAEDQGDASQESETQGDEPASVEGDTQEQEGEADSIEGDTQEEGVEQDGDAASIEGDTLEEEDTAEEGTAASQEREGEVDNKQSEETQESGDEGSGDTETTETVDEDQQEIKEADTAEEAADTREDTEEQQSDDTAVTKEDTSEGDTTEDVAVTKEDTTEGETAEDAATTKEDTTEGETAEDAATTKEDTTEGDTAELTDEDSEGGDSDDNTEEKSEGGSDETDPEEEELTKEREIPTNLRAKTHITQILKLDEESVEAESAVAKNTETTLKTLKNLYDNAIKPLEILYKYRDLSNRHFGDPEIFSKPLVLFMGPWSGGKSSTINYLLDLEFQDMALRTGAEPSPAYFNILMYGDEPEILDGTQLAADWTFSGLQKFGQGLLDRLRGVRLPNRLLEKVNIVEIPGILEIRKQVQRLFPFNDACQWFIDRADIIFLVYDPAKLDVGPETEAILDQLKGREYQTRIILNKADQVKPEELMRVQGTLIWNISPLMSSQEPPVMYTTSLWSLPYESGAPTRLLLAQERAMLRDLRDAIDRRVENKIASARRFAVRVRNHAKMVDCYLTTYYNHKTFFANKKKISDDIIENPTKYHIYEGLSTLTNISRYDLPDPEMYKDFFRINPLYDFTKLSDTCTYFRGCPINKLDVAIAYDLPELVGKYKKAIEAAKSNS